MTTLSAQSIRRLCTVAPGMTVYSYRDPWERQFYEGRPLITPFTERGVVNGRTYGLGPCTYDVRSKGRVFLPVAGRTLASTIEKFAIPTWLCGTVLDKSSHARVFVSAFNTHLDPGWRGHLTVELVNFDDEFHEWAAGDPLCQIRFDLLDFPTELPYPDDAKYQDQPDEPVSAIWEGEDK